MQPDKDAVPEAVDVLGALLAETSSLDDLIADRVQDIVDLSFGVIEDTLLHGTPDQQQGLVSKLAPFMFRKADTGGVEDAEKAKLEARQMLAEMWNEPADG